MIERLSNEEIIARIRRGDDEPRRVFATIRAQTRPGVLRARRRARFLALCRRAWDLRRFVLVAVAFAAIWFAFYWAWGETGLVAAIVGTAVASILFGFILARGGL